MGDELSKAAEKYAKLGLAVFPVLPRSKKPATKHGLKDATTDISTIREGWHRNPMFNIGMATGAASGGVVVIDIDVDPDSGKDGFEYLNKWEREHGELPETVTSITGRGGRHMFYRVRDKVTNTTNEDYGIDLRGDGGYVMMPPSIHPNGTTYQWENDPEDYSVAWADENVLAFMDSVRPRATAGQRFELKTEIRSGNRNGELFKYASSLQARGITDSDLSTLVHKANDERCKPQLSHAEVEKIINSALGYEKGQQEQDEPSSDTAPRKTPNHVQIAQQLMDEYKACFIGNIPAIWVDGRYLLGWRNVDAKILSINAGTKKQVRTEVHAYIDIMAPRYRPADANLIAFNNGIVDMGQGLIPYSVDIHITNAIPWDYHFDCYDETADKFLNDISCDDKTIRMNLEELIGLCMFRSNRFASAAFLLGEGSNGKSTFINAVRNVLGDDNVSSLDVAVIGERFQAGRIAGKLANLGDDISNEYVSGSKLSVFKKATSGETLYTDVKGSDGFEFKPYCTLIFSANEMPRLGDSTDGTLRRMFPIPFNAHFDRDDEGYDPDLIKKLSTKEAAEYFIRLGIEGLQRVIYQSGATPNEYSKKMLEEIHTENDSVLQWLEDEGLTVDDINDRSTGSVFDDYKMWCENSRTKPMKKATFTKRLNKALHLVTVVTRRSTVSGSAVMRIFTKRTQNEGSNASQV